MDQERAQIAVILFADVEQHGLAAGGVLARHQAQVGAQGTTVGELPRVTHLGDHGSGGQRSDPEHLSRAPAVLISPAGTGELAQLAFEQTSVPSKFMQKYPLRRSVL